MHRTAETVFWWKSHVFGLYITCVCYVICDFWNRTIYSVPANGIFSELNTDSVVLLTFFSPVVSFAFAFHPQSSSIVWIVLAMSPCRRDLHAHNNDNASSVGYLHWQPAAVRSSIVVIVININHMDIYAPPIRPKFNLSRMLSMKLIIIDSFDRHQRHFVRSGIFA